jgi:hypothetical protein
MRLSASPVVSERATGADSVLSFLLSVLRARRLAHADPASVARQLTDWIGGDG